MCKVSRSSFCSLGQWLRLLRLGREKRPKWNQGSSSDSFHSKDCKFCRRNWFIGTCHSGQRRNGWNTTRIYLWLWRSCSRHQPCFFICSKCRIYWREHIPGSTRCMSRHSGQSWGRGGRPRCIYDSGWIWLPLSIRRISRGWKFCNLGLPLWLHFSGNRYFSAHSQDSITGRVRGAGWKFCSWDSAVGKTHWRRSRTQSNI